MPTATLTTYECEQDLLPALCTRCGAATTDRVPRPLPVPPRRWTLVWALPVFFVLYVALPLLIVIFTRLLRQTWVRVPVCDAHRDHWAWRERARTRYLWPVICVASLAVEIACLTGLFLHPLLFAHAAAGVIVIGFALDWLIVGRGEIGVVRAGPDRVRLVGVHPNFADALIEERARDRVQNVARRPLRDDVRDDFDDERV